MSYLKTLAAYWFAGSVISVILSLMVMPFGDIAVGLATVFGYLVAVAIYFIRRIPKWSREKEKVYLNR